MGDLDRSDLQQQHQAPDLWHLRTYYTPQSARDSKNHHTNTRPKDVLQQLSQLNHIRLWGHDQPKWCFPTCFYNNNISIHKPILDIDRNNGEMHIKCSSINFSGYSNKKRREWDRQKTYLIHRMLCCQRGEMSDVNAATWPALMHSSKGLSIWAPTKVTA